MSMICPEYQRNGVEKKSPLYMVIYRRLKLKILSNLKEIDFSGWPGITKKAIILILNITLILLVMNLIPETPNKIICQGILGSIRLISGKLANIKKLKPIFW